MIDAVVIGSGPNGLAAAVEPHLQRVRDPPAEMQKPLARRLPADGLLVTQATSPVFARDAFWSIVHTLETAPSPYALDGGLTVRPYHAYVPSFGEWGFVVAGHAVAPWDSITLKVPTRFLDGPTLRAMAHFPRDMARTEVDANTLQTHALPRYYESGWEEWFK